MVASNVLQQSFENAAGIRKGDVGQPYILVPLTLRGLLTLVWNIVINKILIYLLVKKVIVYKSGGELSIFLQRTTYTFVLAHSCNFKQNWKFIKQNSNKIGSL